MARPLKRSWQPPFWAAFGAGGMLSALVGWALAGITGLAVPLGIVAISYEKALAFAKHPLGALALLAVIALFLLHAAHRIFHTLHDFGLRAGPLAWTACYGTAIGATLTAASALLRL